MTPYESRDLGLRRLSAVASLLGLAADGPGAA